MNAILKNGLLMLFVFDVSIIVLFLYDITHLVSLLSIAVMLVNISELFWDLFGRISDESLAIDVGRW
jgi:hypothetical protein